MTITEKKPLLIRIPGEITPNELPVSASAVGYDFVEGNYLIYATGSDSWVTAPPNSGPQYWQSDINNQIFTTGSIVVSGSVILGDAASDVVYISGSVTASNGLTVTGSIYTQMIKVNGSFVDGNITLPGYGASALRGSAFLDDTDATGNSYGVIIRSQAGDLSYASLSFIQDNTYIGSLAGLNNTPSPTTYGYRGGLNISTAQGKVINFRIAYPSALSVGNFNANGLEVTGTLNVSNGAYINAGGMKVAGNISDGGYNGPVIIDDTVTNGSSYGVVIRNQSAADFASANLTLVQNSTYIGAVSGLNNTPPGTTFGLLGGTNIAALKDKVINFRAVDLGNTANSYSFGKFSSTGLDVKGVVTASLGFSGSLTRLTDGTSYIIAGSGISVSSASNGAITIAATGGVSDIYWQSDVNNIIYTTGSVEITGSVTASNGLLVNGNLNVNGDLTSKASSFFGVKEKFNTKSGATGTVVHDCSTGHIFYHSGSTANWTSNFTNLSMSNGYATALTLVVTQSAIAYIPSAVQIEGVAQTLNWQGNTIPTGTASRRDVISFSILNVSSSYVVLGQFVSF